MKTRVICTCDLSGEKGKKKRWQETDTDEKAQCQRVGGWPQWGSRTQRTERIGIESICQ